MFRERLRWLGQGFRSSRNYLFIVAAFYLSAKTIVKDKNNISYNKHEMSVCLISRNAAPAILEPVYFR